MIRFENLSIKYKLIVLIVLTSVFVSFAALIFFSYLDVKSFKEELEQHANINAHLIGNYCITPLTFGYTEDAKKILEELKTIPSINNAIVFSEDDKFFAQYHRNQKDVLDNIAVEFDTSYYKDNYLHVYHPITFQNIEYGTVYFRISTSKIDEKISGMFYILLLLAFGVTIFSFLIANKLQGIISTPLRNLSCLTKKVSEKDDYSIRAKETDKNEIGNLQKGFNNMLEQLETRKKELDKYQNNLEKLVKQRTKKLRETQKELIQNEKMTTLGKLTATVSHELRNPLGTIRSSFYTVHARTKDKQLGLERALERIDRNISRCDNIIEDLLDYSRTKDVLFVEADVDSWFTEFFKEYSIPGQITLETKLESNAKIKMDLERFRRCMINIIDNASQAIIGQNEDNANQSGAIKIQTCTVNKHITIDINDTGSGILKDDIDKIFEPLYSTKSFGFGLGLSVVKQIMDLHNGEISVKSVKNKGTTFTLKLPVSNPN